MEEEINYKYLRKIQEMEKKSPILIEINPEFYSSLSDYIKVLEKRLGKEESSQKKMLLKDEIKNTRKIANDIYEKREKKIMLAAVSKARGGYPDLKNLTEGETSLFNSVLKLMLKNRKDILCWYSV